MAENNFTIDYQWESYLRLSGLNAEYMSDVEFQNLRTAFYAACGQTLTLLRDKVAVFPEDAAKEILNNMMLEARVVAGQG